MNAAIRPRLSAVASRRRQSGVVLVIALIVMVAMTLAGIALFRQSSAGTIIAGNLTFKQAGMFGADRGAEAARAWLMLQSGVTLQTDSSGDGFFSSTLPTFDPTIFNWTSNSKLVTSDDGVGNEIRYVIHRLCTVANVTVNDPNQQCVTLTGSGSSTDKGGGSYSNQSLSSTIQPYFRITTRAAGPRNSVTYTQTILY